MIPLKKVVEETGSNFVLCLLHLYPDLGFLIPSSNIRNQGSLEKWLIIKLGWEKYKVTLEHLVMLDSKEELRKQKDGNMPNIGTESNLKDLPVPQAGTVGTKLIK